VVVGFVQLNLRYEYVVDSVDLAFIEISIIGAGTALIVDDAQPLAKVVK